MDGDTCGEFVTAAIAMATVAVVVGLSLAVPWVGGLVVGGFVAWLVRGWVKDERRHRGGAR